MRFIIKYKVGNSIREDIIEADNLEIAVMKADAIRPSWVDIMYQNFSGLSVFFMILFLGVFINPAQAQLVPAIAVNCILGEARGEGYESMLAHAEAIRNRANTQKNPLKGVYGCNVDLSKEMPYLRSKGIYNDAAMAWKVSRHTNIVKGASFWGSLRVDGAWIEKMEKNGYIRTATIKNTAFYRRAVGRDVKGYAKIIEKE